jgi:hypothetical protein
VNAVEIAVLLVVVALVLALPVICALKGKWGFLLLGLLIHWFWIFGAIRLAKPDSWWARRNYGPDKLDPLEAVVNARKSVFQSFLRAHPEKALPSPAYERFRTLRASYSLALSRFNAQVVRYNAAAKRHNDVLHACEV